jgi:hypothetical protein
MVAIGGIADIVQHWHEMARSRMTPFGHLIPDLLLRNIAIGPRFIGRKSLL